MRTKKGGASEKRMWTFIFAGALYLIGVAVVLVLRPSSMFDASGNWLEFGIGKPANKFTPFPFWMFCLVWALISYVIVLVAQRAYSGSPAAAVAAAAAAPAPVPTQPVELPKGYYVLNRKATKLSGTPKYVYLGTEEP
jgi:hypothetical protein